MNKSSALAFALLTTISLCGFQCTGPLGGSGFSTSSALTQPSTLPSTSLGYGTYDRLFAETSLWNMAPVNPVLSSIGIPADSYFPAVGEGDYSTGIFLASASDPPVTVYPPSGSSGIADPDSGGSMATLTIPHWPASVASAAGTDGHADIVDPTTGLLHSFWQLRQTNGVWTAVLWATSRIDGAGFGDPAHFYQGARAAGVPTSAGLIRKSEYKDGDTMYRHALTMSLTYSGLQASPGYVFPATSSDSDAASTNSGQIPEGALVMLPPDFDVTSLHKADMQKVAQTLKVYGARVVDRNTGTPYVIYVENGAGWVGHGTGWDTAYADDLTAVRLALRMVASVTNFKTRSGAVIPAPDGSTMSLLALRGPWTLNSGSVLGTFDSSTQTLNWGATGSTASVQANSNGTGTGKVSWGTFQTGQVYKFAVKATNGAKLRIEVHSNSDFSTLYQSADLGDGQSVTFTWPASTYVIPIATSGVNVSSSSVSCTLIKQ